MKKYPAIALIELNSIAQGILTADAMIKKSPVSVIKSGTVHNGKFLVLIGGSVASVDESLREGLFIGRDHLIDHVFLPQVDIQVQDALLGKRQPCRFESLAVIEMSTVAENLNCTDAAVKGSDVFIVEIRLADDIGGKAITIFNGRIEETETAVDIVQKTAVNPSGILNTTVIPNLSPEMKRQIDQTTEFSGVNLDQLTDGEI